MPYKLRFSDVSKVETVNVPDMPPGINTVDTSLSLVGRNYPNYGEKIAQNFLYLLENFSSPLPPENPIEGQLWYDTSDPSNKVLRIMDGTADNTRWPAANGIYQQGTDPRTTSAAGIKIGDIWVDTQNNLLKIYHSGDWTTVGPSVSSGLNKTGVEPAVLKSTTNTDHSVIINYVDGKVVSIVSDSQFTPLTVIDGFRSLTPGINLSVNNNAIINGTADMASSLRINNLRYSANRVLIKDDTSQQIITGRIFFQTPANQLNSEGRDGIVIDSGVPSNNTYVQFYKLGNDAVILNNTPGGKIIFKTKPSTSFNLVSGLTVENQSVAINTVTNSSYALNVNGAVFVSGNVVLNSTGSSALSIAGRVTLQRDLVVQQSLSVANIATVSNLLSLGTNAGSGTVVSPLTHNRYDLGSTSRYFRSLYVSTIGSTGTGTTVYGRVIGNATGLEKSSEFKLQGQVTATSFIFAGTGTSAIFNASLTPAAILNQPAYTGITTSTLTLLVIDTSTNASSTGLRKISKYDFLQDVIPTGLILPYGGDPGDPPDGWLFCNGELKAKIDFPKLWEVIGDRFKPPAASPPGLNFYLPDMQYSTTATSYLNVSRGFVQYIIKT